jgi:hypothetical protein
MSTANQLVASENSIVMISWEAFIHHLEWGTLLLDAWRNLGFCLPESAGGNPKCPPDMGKDDHLWYQAVYYAY